MSDTVPIPDDVKSLAWTLAFGTWASALPEAVRHAAMLRYAPLPVGSGMVAYGYTMTDAQEDRCTAIESALNVAAGRVLDAAAKWMPDFDTPTDHGVFDCSVIESLPEAPLGLDVEDTLTKAETALRAWGWL